MKRILFSSYLFEDDEYGKDAYDYAREYLFEMDEEHRFNDEAYTDEQITFGGLESFVCPVCGNEYRTLDEAKACCREAKWESEDDVPNDLVFDEAYHQNEIDWDDFCYEFGNFIDNSKNGFLLCGTVGTWRGSMRGGCYINKFDDLYKFWSGCDYIKIYDENGHIYIEASHHDGTNYAELKEMTDSGIKYMSNHYYDCDEITHQKMFKSNFYTRLPHYCRKVWGTKDWGMKGA